MIFDFSVWWERAGGDSIAVDVKPRLGYISPEKEMYLR